MTNHNNEPAENMQYFAWLHPIRSSESGAYIQDYQFYYYSKKSANNPNLVLESYLVTVDEYNRLGPLGKLKYPMKNLTYKETPAEERHPFWIDVKSGFRFSEPQFKKVALNPDAYIIEDSQKD